MTQAIAFNIAKLRERIAEAEEKFSRRPGSVRLLAVSKTRGADDIRQAAATGLRDFGENYLQEALEKQRELADLPLCWHFIGPLQSNKTRAVAEHFAWVHSVDRLKLARRLSEQRPETLPALNICLQLNISGEPSKSGAGLDELPDLAAEVMALPKLRLRGLMAIPKPSEQLTEQRHSFAQLALALQSLQHQFQGADHSLDTLSMGMSGDLEAAIAEGATMVRIGTALFGPRV